MQGLFDGFPHIYWINMARSLERRLQLQQMFYRLGLANTQVNALDAKDPTSRRQVITCPSDLLQKPRSRDSALCPNDPWCTKYLDRMQFVTASHILAMAVYLNTSTEPFVMIAEDDVSIEGYSEYWQKPWHQYLLELPPDWEVAQLVVMNPKAELTGLSVSNGWQLRTDPNWLSASAYLIRREVAQKIVSMHYDTSGDGRVQLPLAGRALWKSEDVVYEAHVSRTYVLPLLTYVTSGGSTTTPGVDEYQNGLKESKSKILQMWMNVAV
jgi:hypothetical protein